LASSVHEDIWVRQLSEDGRLFYYNKATGASQWHIPNDMYVAKANFRLRRKPLLSKPLLSPDRGVRSFRHLSEGPGELMPLVHPSSRPRVEHSPADFFLKLKTHARKSLVKSMSDTILTKNFVADKSSALMPGDARALKRVDCVTERFFITDDEEEFEEFVEEEIPELKTQAVLRVFIKSARGLRNADAGSFGDKSDPFCTSEVVGRPETHMKTQTVWDNLDPVWDFQGTVETFSRDDMLKFQVWDFDPECEQTFGDDNLGTVLVPVEELLAEHGAIELRLDTGGRKVKSFLTVWVNECTAFPELLGMRKHMAKDRLSKVYPELSIELLEPDIEEDAPTQSVASFDRQYEEKGYNKNFIGACEEDVKYFREGDTLEVFPQRRQQGTRIIGNTRKKLVYNFQRLGQTRSEVGKRGDDTIVYVFVEEEDAFAKKPILTGIQWRRRPKRAALELVQERVYIYYNPETDIVCAMPRTG